MMLQVEVILYIGVRFFWNSIETTQNLDIDIWVDSQPISIGKYYPSSDNLKRPDSISLTLSQGTHHIRAVSIDGKATLDATFELTQEKSFMALTLDYYPKDSPLWTLKIQEKDHGFKLIQQNQDFGWR